MGQEYSHDISSTSTQYLDNINGNTKERFNRLKGNQIEIEGNYNDLYWRIYDNTINSIANIKFSLPEYLMKKGLTKTLIEAIKSWCILLVEENFSVEYIGKKISYVIEAIEISACFDKAFLDKFNNTFFKNNYTQHTTNIKAATLLEFFDYSQWDIEETYMELIVTKYTSTLTFQSLVRRIPSSHDILKFSLVVEDYFKNDLDFGSYLKYYPIYLWWNLTNIIPLRIREFCLIQSNCLKSTKEGYVIELPRLKERQKRVLRYDYILISDSLAASILEYKEKTKGLGETKTLVNYLATRYNPDTKSFRTLKTKHQNSFLYRDFSSLLDSFYEKVVKDTYGFQIIEGADNELIKEDDKYISRKIRPNDTRHFAFLNLMLQGYHPSEIARLGGHKSVYSQYSYHSHLEYWVDSDLVNLLMSQQSSLNNFSNYFFQQILFKQKILNSSLDKLSTMIPLKIGFCTDPNQNCMVNEHYQCEHWRITLEDYQNHFEEFQQLVKNQESLLKTLVYKLLDLHKSGIFNNRDLLYSEENTKFNYRLTEKSNEVKQALYELFKLKERLSPYEK